MVLTKTSEARLRMQLIMDLGLSGRKGIVYAASKGLSYSSSPKSTPQEGLDSDGVGYGSEPTVSLQAQEYRLRHKRASFLAGQHSFSRNVVSGDHLFSLNSVSKPRMLSVRADYVLATSNTRLLEDLEDAAT